MRTILIVAALLVCGCEADPAKATAALEAQGMTRVSLGGYQFFGCGQGDTFNSSFIATGANGRIVEGVVCCGLLKGCTVRFE